MFMVNLFQRCHSDASKPSLAPLSGDDLLPSSSSLLRNDSLRFLVIRLPLPPSPWLSVEMFQKSLGRLPEYALCFFKYFNIADQTLNFVSCGFISTLETYESFQSNLRAMIQDQYPILARTFVSYNKSSQGKWFELKKDSVIDDFLHSSCDIVFQPNPSTRKSLYLLVSICLILIDIVAAFAEELGDREQDLKDAWNSGK
jgi:hypothetical protein